MLKTLFNIVLVVLLFLSTLGYVAYQVTKPGFLLAQAENVHLYDQATTQITGLLPANALGTTPFTQDEVKTIISQSISATTFYNDLGGLSNAYLNWLTGRTATLNYQLNLVNIKRNLTTQASAVLINDYQNLPTCTAKQLDTWDASNGLPSCQLPASNIQSTDVNALLTAQVTQAVDQFSDQVSLPQPTSSLTQARTQVTRILDVIKIIWLVTLAFIVLYIVVARRGAFLSLAIIFLLAGLLEVAFSFIAWDWLERLIVDAVNKPGQSQQIVTMVSTIAGDVTATLKTLLGNISIITLALGGFFLILWAFSVMRHRPKRLETTVRS